LRPLGIPTGNDKMVQEVVRIILERMYEPIFSENSHGFRPGKSCHTALQQINNTWKGVKWIIEFDIKSFFDNINHAKLIEVIEKKVDDKKIINLIRKMLKAGYMEDWKYNSTWSGTPQGGVISPILSNIYLHELDMFMENMIAQFNIGTRRKHNPIYTEIGNKIRGVNRKLQRLGLESKSKSQHVDIKKELMRRRRELQAEIRLVPSKDQFDSGYKRLRYVRYADDFIIGVIGTRKDAELVMQRVINFLRDELLLEYAEDKTCIRNSKKCVRFLGYDIKSYTGSKLMKIVCKNGTRVQRTVAEVMQLHIPSEKVYQFAGKHEYGDMSRFKPSSRVMLTQRSDTEILMAYNAEMRGFVNYYSLAHGYKKYLSGLIGLGQMSLFATLAHKYQTTIGRIASKMRLPNKAGYGLWVNINSKPRLYKLFMLKDHVSQKLHYGSINTPISTNRFKYSRTELITRLNANRCEYCGKEGGYMEVHHVRALKDVWGKKGLWQEMMSAMNRKTMVLCKDCHHELHSCGLPSWRSKVRKHP